MVKSPIILALDTKDLDTAKSWISATNNSISIYKVGLEFFLKFGAAGLQELRSHGDFEVFLDLKLHDIPNTVAGAVASVRDLFPKFLTVHASGGGEMIRAASESGPRISITAVTILTSLTDADTSEIGYAKSAEDSAINLAQLAARNGARSIVCSPFEARSIREVVDTSVEIITPGVRPKGGDLGDQKRVMTPQEAIAAGANYLVIGRPITDLAKESIALMSQGAARILESLT
ncbi:MAG: orotidine-5'-phosphate decarboxylase [Candidatus Nanopelagicaceae bacterium]